MNFWSFGPLTSFEGLISPFMVHTDHRVFPRKAQSMRRTMQPTGSVQSLLRQRLAGRLRRLRLSRRRSTDDSLLIASRGDSRKEHAANRLVERDALLWLG